MTVQTASAKQTPRQACSAILHAWHPLLLYQLGMSFIITVIASPWLLVLSYRLVELSGEPVLGNAQLAVHLASPVGAISLVFWASLVVLLVLVEYAGLILLADAALRGVTLSVGQLVAALMASAPRLPWVSVVFSSAAIVVALPFMGLAAMSYWLLLAGTDINFYLTERPPRFWIAVVIGGVLAGAYAVCMVWLLVRWAFAIPVCALEHCGWLESLRLSWRLMRGRVWRLLLLMGVWQLLKYVAFVAAILALDQLNGELFARFELKLSLLVWSIVLLLLLDAVVMQLLAAVFAIGAAGILAYEFADTRRLQPDACHPNSTPGLQTGFSFRPTRKLQAAIVACLLVAPLASVASALVFSHGIVLHRSVRVTAHRAGPKSAPENSIAALLLARKAGADCVEIDVQQMSDGHVVLVHDRDLRRVTGDPRDVADIELADVGRLRLRLNGQPTDQHVPTLTEFLEACDDTIRLNIEMKDFGRGQSLATAVVAELRAHGFTDRAGVSCFQLQPLLEAKQAEPMLPIGIILSAVKGDATQLPVNFLSLNHRLLNFDVVRRAHRKGMEVHVWTVNDRETALRMLDLGCDNLITSDPALMRYLVDWYEGLSDTERILMRLRRKMRE